MNPLDLLRRGYDTVEIATLLKATEAEVEKQIHRLREEEHRKAVKREQRRAYQQNWMRKYREELQSLRGKA
ncbi:hypothetical protein IB244_31170 [Rhizobium sp. RHZ02]|uniref:hypothetical protein n=1 Tax=Rhizobium sp. RHZ02 TaxID=2769306 RepID=UPI001785EFBD|nr:hypothetical protein [Rhizobium sp. RHZ02]MBD9455933.1 hypothetical protein [Rhizobium sp. RHZ02]